MPCTVEWMRKFLDDAMREQERSYEFHGMNCRDGITRRCPSCAGQTILIGKGGHLTCSRTECKEPGVERAIEKKLREAREGVWDQVINGYPSIEFHELDFLKWCHQQKENNTP